MEAFGKAQELDPSADRKKASGFLLLVGSGPTIVDAGDDRELAIEKAVKLLDTKDTIIFLSKVLGTIGKFKITKDQLIFSRKLE